LLVTCTLVVDVLLKLLIRQVEAGAVGHVHFEAARRETLSLLLLYTGDLLLRVAD
jgi:hypothetical protein